jgi:hypothetical protein
MARMSSNRFSAISWAAAFALVTSASAGAQCTTVLSQNFDGVAVPNLPAGWVTSFTNGDGDCTVGGALCALGSNWTTSNTSADTAPNSAFHNDPSCVTNNLLDAPSVAIPAGTTAQISLRHSFNLEDTFDGGVLEVSINAGAFADIIAAGGSFTAGAYTDTISASFLSPLAGRQAWSGNSGGFVTTTINLPAAAIGQNVQFRFRTASDCSVSGTAWFVDTISVSACAAGCTLTLACPADQQVDAPPGAQSQTVTYPAPVTGGTCVNPVVACDPASGDPFALGTTTVACSATATGATPAECAFDVTVGSGTLQEIPTASGLGLAALALLLAGAGFVALRRLG